MSRSKGVVVEEESVGTANGAQKKASMPTSQAWLVEEEVALFRFALTSLP